MTLDVATESPAAPATLLDHALAAVGRGWEVFPLQPRAKVPLAGSHGFKDATTDEAQIRAWWAAHPDSNIGIATGKRSGFFVIDIDVRNGGAVSCAELVAAFGEFTPTVTVNTRSDGSRHLYYRMPADGRDVRNGKLADGIDVKGSGGYVVGAGSIHPETGAAYVYSDD